MIIIDTNILLFSFITPDELDKKTRLQIEEHQQNNRLIISSISLWEIATLASKKRINVYRPIVDFLKFIATFPGIQVIDISFDIAAESVSLPNNFHKDPADRIIVATTRVYGATLLTRDEAIIKWAKEGHIKCIKG
jgi:PIN domain nuclease of toxin-antitoxin system